MPASRALLRIGTVVLGTVAFALLSCGREVTTEPSNGFSLHRRGMFSVEPVFPRLMNGAALSAAVDFQKVHIVLRRADGSIALDTTVVFPPGADSVALAADVALASGTGSSGENFKLNLGYVNAAGDTVFKGGPVDVTVVPKGSSAAPPAVSIPVVYSGAGASATAVRISPRSASGFPGDRVSFTAQALDASGRAIAGTPIFWVSGDANMVSLGSNLAGDGVITGGRGTVRIFAQLLTGPIDTVTVSVQPRAQQVTAVSGDQQSSAPGRTLPKPLVVKVLASDGLPVTGVTVAFVAPGGSVAPTTAVTDASGLASTNWTLPTASGSATATATVGTITGAAGQVTFFARVVPPVATRLVFEAMTPSTMAGSTLVTVGTPGVLRVSAKDSSGAVIPTTGGTVTIALNPVPDSSARLSGTMNVNLVDGVATFTDLWLNRVGTGYLLTAASGALTPATSVPFAITEGPATQLRFSTQSGNGVAGRRLNAMTVTALDAWSNTATQFRGDVTLRINVNPGAGTLSGTATRTASGGAALFSDIAIDRVGVGYTLSASAIGLTGGGTTPFDIQAGAPSRLAVVRGAGQTAPVGATLDTIFALVTDSLGNAVSGAGVSFVASAGSGSVTVINGVTNGNGVARVRWTLGAAAGPQSLTVAFGTSAVLVTATAVGSLGPTHLFIGADTMYVTAGTIMGVSVFLTAPQAVPVTVALSSLDTLAQWSAASVVIPAGSTAATATFVPKGGVSGWGHLVASASGVNADTLALNITPATVRLLNSYLYLSANSDTVETQVVLSAPAPAGGITVQFDIDSAGSTRVHLAPSPGTRQTNPYNPCNEIAEPASPSAASPSLPEPARLTTHRPANVLSPTTVFIKAGELSAFVYVIGDTAGYATITPLASGFSSQSASATVSSRYLYLNLSHDPAPNVRAPETRSYVWVYREQTSTQQLQPVTLTVRTAGIIGVPGTVVIAASQSSASFSMDMLALGRTWLVAQAPGFAPDSAEIIVSSPRLNSCIPYCSYHSVNLYIGNTANAYVYPADSLGQNAGVRTSLLTVSAVSRNPARVVPSFASVDMPVGQSYVAYPLNVVSAGPAWIVFTAPGHAADSVQVTGLNYSVNTYYGRPYVGVGQVEQGYLERLNGVERSVSLTAVSSDPAVLSVDSLTLMRANSYNSDYVRMVGRSPGSVTVTFTADSALYMPKVVSMTVTTPAFAHTVPCCLTAGGPSTTFEIMTMDSTRIWAHDVAHPLTVSLRSLDSTIAQVDSTVIVPEQYSYHYVLVRPVAGGSTSIIVTAAGYRPDTVPVTVTGAAAPTLYMSAGPAVALGKKQLLIVDVSRNVASAAATVSVTKTGSATTVTPSSFAPAAGSTSVGSLNIKAGTTAGQDNIVVSSPGYVPDTVNVRVGSPKLGHLGPYWNCDGPCTASTVLAGDPNYYVDVYLADSLGNAHYAGDTVRVNLTSSDTTVAFATPSVVTFLPGDYVQTVPVTWRGPGTVRFRLHETTGLYPDDSTSVTTVLQQYLHFGWSQLYVGMRQATAPGEVYVYSDYAALTNTVVKFARSTSALVSMPDSVIIPAGDNYGYFQISGADTVGSLQITATSPGFVSATANVEVTRPAFSLYVPNITTVNNKAPIQVAAVETGRYYTRAPTESVPVSLALDSTFLGTLDATTITLPAGTADWSVGTVSLTGVPGHVGVRAYDARPAFRHYLEARGDLYVNAATVQNYPNPLRVGIGQTSSYSLYSSYYLDNGLIVTYANPGAHTGRAGASADTIPVGEYYHYGTWTGVSYGRDIITLTSPRTQPYLWSVQVDSGSFELSVARSIKAGDSVWVTVNIRGPGGEFARAAVPTSVTATVTNGNFVAGSGSVCGTTSPTCTMPIAAGDYWAQGILKPTAAGVARLTITAPNYRPLSIDIPVSP